MALKHVLDIIKKQKSPIFALYGDLGAGKTYFVKQVGKLLKINDTISSPTFLILKTYKIPNDDRLLVHTDFYRFKDNPTPNIIDDIALFDYIDMDIIFMEWPDVIMEFLPVELQKRIIKINIRQDLYNNRLFDIIIPE